MRALILFACLFAAPIYLERDANADDAGVVVAGSGSSAGSTATSTTSVTVVVPDPNVDPLGDASAAYKLYKAGAYIPMVVVVAFAVLTLLKGKIPVLNQGKTAAYLAAGIGFLAALIPAAANGQTPTLAMLLTAVGVAIALITHPADPSQTPA